MTDGDDADDRKIDVAFSRLYFGMQCDIYDHLYFLLLPSPPPTSNLATGNEEIDDDDDDANEFATSHFLPLIYSRSTF